MRYKLPLVAVVLGLCLLALAAALLACGSEEEAGKSGELAPTDAATKASQATPAATNTPINAPRPAQAATPVPDDISAEDLRQLVAAAAATVNDVTFESSSGPHAESRNGASQWSRKVTGPPYSPPLNVGETLDLLIVNHKRYYRASGGPWITDSDDPGAPYRAQGDLDFPDWYPFIREPVGVPASDAWLQPSGVAGSTPTTTVTWADTITGMSVSGPAAGATGRCWDLTVDYREDSDYGGGSSMDHQDTFTVCEPDFLVVKEASGNLDNFRYNTGIDLAAPDQVTVVHCGPYDAGVFNNYSCLFAR